MSDPTYENDVMEAILREQLSRMREVSTPVWTAEIENRDGVSWNQAPLPPRLHRCSDWSTGRDALGLVVFKRCACGGSWVSGGWIERNSRRKGKRAGRRAGRALGGRAGVLRLAAVSVGASAVSAAVALAVWWLLDGDPGSVVIGAVAGITIGLTAGTLFPFRRRG